MSKRRSKKAVTKRCPVSKPADFATDLRAALAKRKKAELVDLLLELACDDRGLLRQLTARFEVASAPEALAAATRQAIADATDFDGRDINRNFDYDDEAYHEVQRNLSRLIDAGQLPLAMQLALELMHSGSHQVEASDEGLMSQDIENCQNVVIKALRMCDLPAEKVIAWCAAVLASDRVGCIGKKQLESLRRQFQTCLYR